MTQSIQQVSPVIGTVKGPGETGNQYVFITANNRQVKTGEFVYYTVDFDDTPAAQILGKISERRLIDHLPDRLFVETEIDPEAIAALVGFAYPNPEIYEVTVDVIGYFHPALGFINPRIAPDPGAKVCLADDDTLRQIINKKQPQSTRFCPYWVVTPATRWPCSRCARCERTRQHPYGNFGRYRVW